MMDATGQLDLGFADLPETAPAADDGYTPPPPAFEGGSLRFLRAGGIYGIWLYVSMFGSRASHDYVSAREAQKVYNFKKYGKKADAVKGAMEFLAETLGCSEIVACPGHTPATTRLQELFGTTLARIREVQSRKYDHEAAINFEYERSTLEIPDDFYARIKGGRVLVVDDVATTGKTLRFYRLLFESVGVQAELAAVGIGKKMLPERTGPEWVPPERPEPKSGADRVAEFVARRNEIGELPPVEDPERRAECEVNSAQWLREYFPGTFTRPFCRAHLDYIADIDEAVEHGGLKAIALPRAFGKTAITVAMALKTILTGRRRFLVVVAATDAAAARIAKDIQGMLLDERLARDYPEYCRPFLMLQGKAQRCASQTYLGKPTGIQATADLVQLPRMGGPADGAAIVTRGITGAIRGLHLESGGEWIRPDFVLLDDIQTRESAKSEAQTEDREAIVTADILGLAGHERDIAAAMCCTVIAPGDLSARFLDQERHPEWRGAKCAIIDTFGGKGEDDLWRDYDQAWRRESSGKAPRGTALSAYAEIREAAATACHPADPLLFGDGEADAIQHARNLFLKSRDKFFAEYMNSPVALSAEAPYLFRASDVLRRVNGRRRGEVPEDAVKLVCAADVNRYSMAYAVAAIGNAGDISVIDYGWWMPPGRKDVFSLDGDKEGEISSAVSEFIDARILDKAYGPRLDFIVVDAGYEQNAVASAVEAARRRWGRQTLVYAAKGLPADKYAPPRNRRTLFGLGDGCDIRRTFPAGLLFIWDSHQHHMRAQKGFLFAPGAAGAITVFGDPRQAEAHLPFAEQVAADELQATKPCDNGRTFAVFETHGRHNEMSDCMAEISAVASLQSVVRARQVQAEAEAEAGAQDGEARNGGEGDGSPLPARPAKAPVSRPRRGRSFVVAW